jgi:uncharacterized protein (TIGR02421 family)
MTNLLEINEIIERIEEGKTLDATTSDGAVSIKINKYVPFVCTAIHAGSRLRPELLNKIALNEYQRWYEEDPHTDDFISSMPITLIGNDSRYEYDLNRHPDHCIYDEAWGVQVWDRKLNPKEILRSKEKHTNFYAIVHALIAKIEQLFGACVVYDIHSYNYKRWDRPTPIFNIGTERIDNQRYSKYVMHWFDELRNIKASEESNTTGINDVFFGRGYNLEYITKNFPNTLVLATEIKKIYCDETTGDTYPKIIRKLQQKFKQAIISNARFFCADIEQYQEVGKVNLLDRRLDPELLRIDKTLFDLLKNFELLAAVNPINAAAEKKRFFKNNEAIIPKFKYQPIKINAYELKQQLMDLPVQNIQDISIRAMYEAVVTSYCDKIDIISTLDTPRFLFNNLRYFGRPSKADIQNAVYLLHLPFLKSEAEKEPMINLTEAKAAFKTSLDAYGIQAKIETSSKVISQVMVLNSKKSILFQPNAVFRKKELYGLVEHEIGVHMTTTMNSLEQPLKIFNLGLPLNTLTQEGLAVLAEYLSGNITLRRLKKLALRVIAVDSMCNGANFLEAFWHLTGQYNATEIEAYDICTRVYRGGGFTKDFLYLRGFVQVLKMWENHENLEPLFVGKTSLSYLSTLEELIDRGMIEKPTLITQSLKKPKIDKVNPIYTYILSGLKANT